MYTTHRTQSHRHNHNLSSCRNMFLRFLQASQGLRLSRSYKSRWDKSNSPMNSHEEFLICQSLNRPGQYQLPRQSGLGVIKGRHSHRHSLSLRRRHRLKSLILRNCSRISNGLMISMSHSKQPLVHVHHPQIPKRLMSLRGMEQYAEPPASDQIICKRRLLFKEGNPDPAGHLLRMHTLILTHRQWHQVLKHCPMSLRLSTNKGNHLSNHHLSKAR